jgi:hypothetical protein
MQDSFSQGEIAWRPSDFYGATHLSGSTRRLQLLVLAASLRYNQQKLIPFPI